MVIYTVTNTSSSARFIVIEMTCIPQQSPGSAARLGIIAGVGEQRS